MRSFILDSNIRNVSNIRTTARRNFAITNAFQMSSQEFSVEFLISGMQRYARDWWVLADDILDNAEFFTRAHAAVAIVAHCYVDDDCIEEFQHAIRSRFDGPLMIDIPVAGKRASWIEPNVTLPVCLTHPDITVHWPSEEEMIRTVADYETATSQRKSWTYKVPSFTRYSEIL
jgi:hypothetical protein